jgi:hypothetical protein
LGQLDDKYTGGDQLIADQRINSIDGFVGTPK